MKILQKNMYAFLLCFISIGNNKVFAELKTDQFFGMFTASLLAPTSYIATLAANHNNVRVQQQAELIFDLVRLSHDALIMYREHNANNDYMRFGNGGLMYTDMALTLYSFAEHLHDYIVGDLPEHKHMSKAALVGKIVLPLLESIAAFNIAATNLDFVDAHNAKYYLLNKFIKSVSLSSGELLSCSADQQVKIIMSLSALLFNCWTYATLANKRIAIVPVVQQETTSVQPAIQNGQLSNNGGSVNNVINNTLSSEQQALNAVLDDLAATGFPALRDAVLAGDMTIDQALIMRATMRAEALQQQENNTNNPEDGTINNPVILDPNQNNHNNNEQPENPVLNDDDNVRQPDQPFVDRLINEGPVVNNRFLIDVERNQALQKLHDALAIDLYNEVVADTMSYQQALQSLEERQRAILNAFVPPVVPPVIEPINEPAIINQVVENQEANTQESNTNVVFPHRGVNGGLVLGAGAPIEDDHQSRRNAWLARLEEANKNQQESSFQGSDQESKREPVSFPINIPKLKKTSVKKAPVCFNQEE